MTSVIDSNRRLAPEPLSGRKKGGNTRVGGRVLMGAKVMEHMQPP